MKISPKERKDEKTMSKLDILKAAEEVKPITIENGVPYVSFEDAEILKEAAKIENKPDIGQVKFNADGSVARSRTDFAVVNVEMLYQNRFRYIEDENGKPIAMQVVTDPLAIDNQVSGRVYASRITAYEIVRDGKELALKKITTVSDDEFIEEFKKTLTVRDMEKIVPLIQGAGSDISRENIAI